MSADAGGEQPASRGLFLNKYYVRSWSILSMRKNNMIKT